MCRGSQKCRFHAVPQASTDQAAVGVIGAFFEPVLAPLATRACIPEERDRPDELCSPSLPITTTMTNLVNIRQHTTPSDGRLDHGVQLFVTPDGQLQVPGRDPLHPQILSGISYEQDKRTMRLVVSAFF